jgi:hypothetical protein
MEGVLMRGWSYVNFGEGDDWFLGLLERRLPFNPDIRVADSREPGRPTLRYPP